MGVVTELCKMSAVGVEFIYCIVILLVIVKALGVLEMKFHLRIKNTWCMVLKLQLKKHFIVKNSLYHESISKCKAKITSALCKL